MPIIRAPQLRPLTPIQKRQPKDFTQEILAVQGQNPFADAISQIGKVAGGAIENRQKLAEAMSLGQGLGLDETQAKTLTAADLPALRQLHLNRTLPKTEEQETDIAAKLAEAYSKLYPQSQNVVLPGTTGPGGNPVVIPSRGPAIPTEIGGSQTPAEDPAGKAMREEILSRLSKLRKLPQTPPASPPEGAVSSSPVPGTPAPIKLTKIDSGKEETRQDKLEAEVIARRVSLRGDTALQNVETKRDNSIAAYNTIEQIKQQGRPPTPFEMEDIVSGALPRLSRAEVKDVVKTAGGDLSRLSQYITGSPASGAPQDILLNLQEIVKGNGLQADKLHEGYMKEHATLPEGLSPELKKKYNRSDRGTSFAEATGLNNLKTLPKPGGSPKPGGVLNIDAKGNWAWVYPDGTFDEVR